MKGLVGRSDRPNGLVGRSDRPSGLVSRSDRPSGLVGRYVATDRVAWSVVSGILALLRVERKKIEAAPYDVCKLAGFLKTLEYWPGDKFWDLVSGWLILCLEMLETSVLGLGQDLGLITALGGAMTTSTYVSRIVFDLIPSRFKVRKMFSAYVTCMVGIDHLFEDNF
ncbi:hypothetical protein DY000_02030341 [Brassica cretica]|uniref:Uncharacterized protein n=1 Tax=Brassica cretica TaxID=69181 RepID=A0ABQ7E0T9_BRACR|nr:hypothetical protein DY000_02030341 [Brassica cretica]